MMASTIHIEQDKNHNVILTLNRPETRNALNWEMMEAFAHNIESISRDNTIRVLIITGKGDAFWAGGDLLELHNYASHSDGERLATFMGDALSLLFELPIPVIAAINGPAIGGGAEIALACDLRISSENALIGFPQINLALTPAWGGAGHLVYLIGYQHAYSLLSSGEIIDCQRAFEIGLINNIVAKGRALEAAINIAQKLTSKNSATLRALKKIMRAHRAHSASEAREFERSIFAELWTSEAHIMESTRFIKQKEPQ
jgi:enoyl-CoA hydratase